MVAGGRGACRTFQFGGKVDSRGIYIIYIARVCNYG